jgi:hypothetical protein
MAQAPTISGTIWLLSCHILIIIDFVSETYRRKITEIEKLAKLLLRYSHVPECSKVCNLQHTTQTTLNKKCVEALVGKHLPITVR